MINLWVHPKIALNRYVCLIRLFPQEYISFDVCVAKMTTALTFNARHMKDLLFQSIILCWGGNVLPSKLSKCDFYIIKFGGIQQNHAHP